MASGGRKRERFEGSFTGDGGFKKSRDEMKSFTTGVGSKSKPCMKFFSTSGCQFGELCHFLHYAPGYSAFSQLSNGGGNASMPVGRNMPFSDGPSSTSKSKICNRFNRPEGCKFGENCYFSHGDMPLGRPLAPGYEDRRGKGSMSRFSGQVEESNSYRGGAAAAAGGFGTSVTTKISINASIAGAVIGKNGVNSKHICQRTGVKLAIRDHESDPTQRTIELEGTFDQINEASSMVRERILNIRGSGNSDRPSNSFEHRARSPPPPGRHYKSRMCENYNNGNCSFGERCHFAHSASELRRPPNH